MNTAKRQLPMADIMPAKDKIIKARTALILGHPFFGSLAMRLQAVEDNNIPTAYTDGKQIRYSPKFIEEMTVAECSGVVAHEIMHCAMGHTFRRGERKHGRFNKAGDYAINGIIEDAGLKLPDGRLREAHFDNKSAEEIYASLPDEDEGGGGGGGQGSDPGGCGGVEDAKDNAGNPATPQQQAQQQADWQVATVQAAQAAKMQGKLPAGLERLVNDITNPKVDWRTVLRQFVEKTAKNDYSWARPNRRYTAQGLYMPVMQSEQLKPVSVAIDTSGSIDDKLLADFAGELMGISAEYTTAVNVVYCDAGVQGEQEFQAGERIRLEAKGGGGTDFRPAFDHIEKSGKEPACIIYFTDGWGDFPEKAPEYPVLWAVTGDGKEDKAFPFGEVVRL